MSLHQVPFCFRIDLKNLFATLKAPFVVRPEIIYLSYHNNQRRLLSSPRVTKGDRPPRLRNDLPEDVIFFIVRHLFNSLSFFLSLYFFIYVTCIVFQFIVRQHVVIRYTCILFVL